jgi:hypothetical protein
MPVVSSVIVMAVLDPAITGDKRDLASLPTRSPGAADGRVKPGHDVGGPKAGEA